MTNPVKAFQAALSAHQKRASGGVQDLVTIVEDEFARIAKVNDALKVIWDQQLPNLDDAVQQGTDALADHEAKWLIWGVDKDGEEFEATIDLWVSGSGRGKLYGVYRLDTPTVMQSHMGENLVGPAERDPKKLLPVLSGPRGYGLTRLSWDRQ